jgi:subfamily B ATP-binding cassette protein MsbA
MILVVTVLASVAEMLNLAAFFPLFRSVLETNDKANPGGILGIVTATSKLLPFREPIIAAAVLLVIVALFKAIMILVREGLVAYASGSVQHDIKNRLLEKYANSPYEFFLEQKQGSLIYNLGATTQVGILMFRVPQITAEMLKIGAIAVVLLGAQPILALSLGIFGLFYNWLTLQVSRRVSYHTGKGRAIAASEQTTIAHEFFRGFCQIMVLCTKREWLKRFEYHGRVFRDLYIKDVLWQNLPRNMMEITAVLLMLAIMFISRSSGGAELPSQLPMVGVFVIALVQLLPSLAAVGRIRMELVGSLPNVELVHQALTRLQVHPNDGILMFSSLRDGITLDRVSFAYRERAELLHELTPTFEKGRITAIVGPSGAGKTTIANLILGLFEPTQGRVLVDGIPLREYCLETWLQRIGFVSQDPFIFHDTIAENITCGRSGYSRQAIQKAAGIANAHGFILELPQAYDTVVGERGMKLSGGQQQRIAIARAVLGDPEIFIFDEATSSLDTVSERLVQEAIETISRDRTVIIIAHRLSTIRFADKIVVLDNGRIIEEGNHQELLNARGRYSQLVAAGQEWLS